VICIECPFCGPREEHEFFCGGEAHKRRPAAPEQADDASWAHYLYGRENSKGPYTERWLHVFGCEQWLNVTRDTRSHAILAVAPVSGDAAGWKPAE